MLNESEIIEHFFTPEKLRHDVRVGVGDDSRLPQVTYFLHNNKVVQNWQGWQHFGI